MSRRVLLDTGPAFDCLFNRCGIRGRVVDARKRGVKIGIGMPVLGEIIGGIEASQSREHSWNVDHQTLSAFVLWPFDREAAYEYGRLYALLKKVGRPMQQIDIQIAAIALTLGDCTVVSGDRDLTAIPNLKVENWLPD
ncbi:MAG TPA: type II toxin-antitoxin system VapC family toxin [Gemmataceae bacterium]|jgi:tRNA(fMet)-specific endonuclease VapC